MQIGAWLLRADRVVERVEAALLSTSILAMAAVNIANVLARNALGRSFSFAEELSQVLAIAVTFGGVGYVARIDRHIRMSAFHDALPPRPREILWCLIGALTSALLFVLAFHALGYVRDTWATGSVTPALRVPLFAVYALAPAGLALGGLQYALALVRRLGSPAPGRGAPSTPAGPPGEG